MPSLADWSPNSHHVQGGLREGNFVNSQYVLIAAGPPFLKLLYQSPSEGFTKIDGNIKSSGLPVFPIGLVQGFSISQSKSMSRIFEIGSDRSYFIAGRSMGQVSFSRALFHGPSILRVAYAYYDTTGDTEGFAMKSLYGPKGGHDPFGIPPFRANDVGELKKAPLHSVKVPPGYDNFFMNLASDLFSQPFGLLLIVKDNEENTYGSVYMEQCYIPMHSFGFESQGLMVGEQVSIQYERIVPIKSSQVKLVRDVGGTASDGFMKDFSGGYGTATPLDQ